MGLLSKRSLFARIAIPTWGRWVVRRNNIVGEGLEAMAEIKPPYLVLCNHAHTLDPFFISILSPMDIRWVAGAYLFKLPFLATLLHHLVGAISKQQGRSDMHMMRQITAAFKKGDVVGIFPEGTRTWDGEPVGFDPSLAKLIKLFKVPVVLLNFEGLYGIKPRWTDYRRRGRVILRFKSVLGVEEAKAMSVDELYAHLNNELSFSFRSWQKVKNSPFVGKRAAEGVEKALYLCPSCKKGSTIQGEGRTITCKSCNLSYTLNEYERLESNTEKKPRFDDIAAWRVWQRSYLQAYHPSFPPDEGALFQTGDEKQLQTIAKTFTLVLKPTQMVLTTKGKTYIFDFDSIESMIINAKSTLEFYAQGTLYRIRIKPHLSILKYLELYTTFAAKEATS